MIYAYQAVLDALFFMTQKVLDKLTFSNVTINLSCLIVNTRKTKDYHEVNEYSSIYSLYY